MLILGKSADVVDLFVKQIPWPFLLTILHTNFFQRHEEEETYQMLNNPQVTDRIAYATTLLPLIHILYKSLN